MNATLAPSLDQDLATLRQRALDHLRQLESGETPSPELWALELSGGDRALAGPLAALIAQDHARLRGEA